MHSSDLFERILARVTTPEQAAAIVGDHLETSKTSKRPFLLTMSFVVLALAWHRPVIWLASFAVGCSVYSLMRDVFLMCYRLRHAVIAQDRPRLIAFGTVTTVVWLMGFAAPYAALRFGLRDRYTKLCFALLLVAMSGVLLQPYRAALLASANAIPTVMLSTAFAPRWRRPALALLATLSAGSVGIVVTNILTNFWSDHWLRYHSGWGWFSLHTVWGFDLYRLIAPASDAIILAILATTASRMHNWAARKGDPATHLDLSA